MKTAPWTVEKQMSGRKKTHLEKEKSNEVEKAAKNKRVVSHYVRHDNAGVDGVCSDTYMNINQRRTLWAQSGAKLNQKPN